MTGKIKLLLLLATVFLLGASAGFVGNEQLIRWRFARFERNPDALPRYITQRLTAKLDLTPAQQAAVLAIFEDAGQQFKTHREQADQEIAAIRDNITTQIDALLTPEQQPLYEAHKAERAARRAAKSKRPPPPR